MSKQDLMLTLGLSLPTVTTHLTELTEAGLVIENGTFGNTGGRNAKGYSIDVGARLALGVDVNKTHISVVVADLYGNILHSTVERRLYEKSPAYYRRLGELVISAMERAQVTQKQLLGIGISVQGLLSEDRKEVTFGPILDNKGETVEIYTEHIPYSCELFHDADSAAFAEMWVSPELSNAVYVSLSTNLGGALIIGRDIFSGSGFTAGKLEHMTLHPGGKLCYCGKAGCADSYCAVTYLTEGIGDGGLASFFEALEAGESAAAARWDQYLEDLAILVNNLYTLMDSDVILGGYLAPYVGPYLEELKTRAYARNGVLPGTDYLKLARFQSEAIAAGSALRLIDSFIKGV
ncbi:MAG: ROK family transcriptional regulator [Oscillospiraceae bacterium]|nr:ROK family transcriptional regulator [Oscillospiraceae bacterium]